MLNYHKLKRLSWDYHHAKPARDNAEKRVCREQAAAVRRSTEHKKNDSSIM